MPEQPSPDPSGSAAERERPAAATLGPVPSVPLLAATGPSHTPRRYDRYLAALRDPLGTTRGTAAPLTERYPVARAVAVEERRFLRRTVDHLVRAGVRQFLVLGGGPSTTSLLRPHAQLDPPVRMVRLGGTGLTQAITRGLLGGDHPEPGPDARPGPEPDARPGPAPDARRGPAQDRPEWLSLPRLLTGPQAQSLDLAAPVGVLLIGVLHLLPDRSGPYGAIGRLLQDLAPGSYLALTHLSADGAGPGLEAALRVHRRTGLPIQLRDRAEIGRFFLGLDLIDPGVVRICTWRPGGEPGPAVGTAPCYAGLGRVPERPTRS